MDEDYPLFNPENNYSRYGLKGYEYFFNESESSLSKIRIEATPDYMYQKTPLKVIPIMPEIPLIVFILRKPSDRIYSLFRFAQNNLAILDQSKQFADFICMIKARDNRILKNRPILRNAIEHSKYVNYIDLWYEILGPANILLLIFEELKDNPKQFMIDLSNRLQIDSSFYESYNFEKKNPTLIVRNQKLHRIKKRISKLIANKNAGSALNRIYLRMNIDSRLQKPNTEDRVCLNSLDKEFFSFNKQLAETYQLNLSPWGI